MSEVSTQTKLIEVIDHKATGQLARQRREEKGISLRSIAREMKISAMFLSHLERGLRHWNDGLITRFNKSITKSHNHAS